MTVHVRQPEGSRLCGHSVLAMVLGVPLDRACEVMGHRRGTRTRELVAALGEHALDSRLRVIGKRPLLGVPDPCVLKVRWKKGSHYVLRVGTAVYDPEFPRAVDLLFWTGRVALAEGRITSFLPVRLA